MIGRILPLWCLAVAIPAGAASACTMGVEAFEATLDGRVRTVERVLSSRRLAPRIYEEAVRLRNGRTVTLTLSGCNHFGVRLRFEGIPGLVRDAPPADLIRTARNSVAVLPVRKDRGMWLDDILDGLDAQAGAPDPLPLAEGFTFACGEYKTCEIFVPRPGVLELVYVFAL
jgi:hypothetical protein